MNAPWVWCVAVVRTVDAARRSPDHAGRPEAIGGVDA